jgi:hypothetical protein
LEARISPSLYRIALVILEVTRMTWKKMKTFLPDACEKTRTLLGLAILWSASSGWAFARGTPEIDPGSATSALALLVGGMLLLKPRWWRK